MEQEGKDDQMWGYSGKSELVLGASREGWSSLSGILGKVS